MANDTSNLRWLAQLAKRLIQATPVRSALATGATLVSQGALMVGMLLPIKVIMLLGMDAVPSYMPAPLEQMALNTLILLLSGLAVVFYGIYSLGERVANIAVDSSAADMVRQADKVVLFENQNHMAANGYKKVVNSLAGILFALAVLALLGLIYPELSLALIVFTLLCIPFAHGKYRQSIKQANPQLFNQTLNHLGNISFLLTFAVAIVDHLYSVAPSVLFIIVALILSRQASSKIATSMMDLAEVLRLRDKLSALFFQEHLLSIPPATDSSGIWAELSPQELPHWVSEVIQQAGHTNLKGDNLRIDWLQSTIPNVFVFRASDLASEDAWIIKIYDTSRTSLALHETSLLSSPNAAALPAPRLMHSTVLNGYQVHLLALPKAATALEDRLKLGYSINQIGIALCFWTPPQELVTAYCRSRPLLWQKLQNDFLDTLTITANTEQRQLIAKLNDALPEIRTLLSKLPLVITNPSLNYHTIVQMSEHTFLALQWGQWGLDVLGSNFPPNDGGIKNVCRAVEKLHEDKPEVNLSAAKLACWLAGIEGCQSGQRFLDALDMLPGIETCLEELGLIDSSRPESNPPAQT